MNRPVETTTLASLLAIGLMVGDALPALAGPLGEVPVAAAPAGATVAAPAQGGDSALEQRVRAMLLASSALPSSLPAAPAAHGLVKDPWRAALWSAGPPLAMLALGLTAGWAESALIDRSYAEQSARGIFPVDQTTNGLPLGLGALSLLPGATPVAFGGGQYYAGHPWRSLWVTLGGPAVTMGGFLAGAVVGGFVPATQIGGTGVYTKPSLQLGIASGILACAGFGLWSAWDAYRLVAEAPVAN